MKLNSFSSSSSPYNITSTSQKDFSSSSRDEHKLSLRKHKIEDSIMKKRFQDFKSSTTYSLNISSIQIPKTYENKTITSFSELFLIVSSLLNSYSYNDICFGIILLRENNSISSLTSESELIQTETHLYLLKVLSTYMKDVKVVNEIIIIISRMCSVYNDNIIELFTQINYLTIYAKVFTLYVHDNVIKHNLIILLGNLVCKNTNVQSAFYKTEIFKAIFDLNSSIKEHNDTKDLCIWFITCFVQGIITNQLLESKVNEVIIPCQKIFMEYVIYEQYTFNCLYGVYALSEHENEDVIIAFINNKQFMEYLLGISEKYYYLANQILCNLFSNNKKIDAIVIKRYDCFSFLKRGLDMKHNLTRAEVLNTLMNLVSDENKEMCKMIIDKDIIIKVIAMLKEFIPLIVCNVLLLLRFIIKGCDNEMTHKLIHVGVVDEVMNTLRTNYDQNVIEKAIECIYIMTTQERALRLDENSGYVNAMERKGCKELLENILTKPINNEIERKTKFVLKLFQSSNI